jgi:hypothetical protein
MLARDRRVLAGAGVLLLAALHAWGALALWAAFSVVSATADAYGAVLWTIAGFGIAHAAVVVLMVPYVLVALLAGRLGAARPLALENTVLVAHYTSGAVLAGLALVVLFPLAIGHG